MCILSGLGSSFGCLDNIAIVKWIKGQKLSWLGHLQRMEEDRMPKKSSLKNWKGREEGEDPGKDGKRK